MKRTSLLLSLAICATPMMPGTAASQDTTAAQREAGGTFPRYPLWLAYPLARVGIPGAQALAGFHALAHDPCKGSNWLLSAAQKHHPFGEWQLIGYYFMMNEEKHDVENLKKVFLWHLHWATHFPDDEDISHQVVRMTKLTPDEEAEVREKFKTWTPDQEPRFAPESCPSDKFARK